MQWVQGKVPGGAPLQGLEAPLIRALALPKYTLCTGATASEFAARERLCIYIVPLIIYGKQHLLAWQYTAPRYAVGQGKSPWRCTPVTLTHTFFESWVLRSPSNVANYRLRHSTLFARSLGDIACKNSQREFLASLTRGGALCEIESKGSGSE